MQAEVVRELIAERVCKGEPTRVIMKVLKVHRNLVNHVKKMLANKGTVKKTYGGGQPRTKRSPEDIRAVKGKINWNARRSIRKLAADHDMSKRSMRRVIKSDLGMKSRAVVTKNRINPGQMGRRYERCKKILNWLKCSENTGKGLIFNDEKLFYVNTILNI